MKYIDCNGEIIEYGDILRFKFWEISKSPNAPKEPFFMLVQYNNETMMYVSGMDEYMPIEECKRPSDKINELGAFEIFVKNQVINKLNESLGRK